MRGVMIQGTASDVGKSMICTALCRLLSEQEIRATHFKLPNTSFNSYVTEHETAYFDGEQIERIMEEDG